MAIDAINSTVFGLAPKAPSSAGSNNRESSALEEASESPAERRQEAARGEEGAIQEPADGQAQQTNDLTGALEAGKGTSFDQTA